MMDDREDWYKRKRELEEEIKVLREDPNVKKYVKAQYELTVMGFCQPSGSCGGIKDSSEYTIMN
jgi:hypothetical protein